MTRYALALGLMLTCMGAVSAYDLDSHGNCELDVTQPMWVGYLVSDPAIDVIAGSKDGTGQVCIAIPDQDAFGDLIDADAIAVRQSKREVDWQGAWEHYGARLTITSGVENGWIEVDGYAEYGADDPERVANGSVNVGGFNVPAQIDPSNPAYLAFATSGELAIPFEQAEEFDCKVQMRRVGKWLWAVDNGMCGGLNVSFTGVYERADEDIRMQQG